MFAVTISLILSLIYGELLRLILEFVTRYKMTTAAILLLTGIGLIYSIYKFVKLFVNFQKLALNGVKVRGVIETFKIPKEGRYSPVVKFKTYSGTEIVGQPIKDYSEREHYDLPDKVEVTYLESAPGIFLIQDQRFKPILYLDLLVSIGCFIFIMNFVMEQNLLWFEEVKEFLKGLSSRF